MIFNWTRRPVLGAVTTHVVSAAFVWASYHATAADHAVTQAGAELASQVPGAGFQVSQAGAELGSQPTGAGFRVSQAAAELASQPDGAGFRVSQLGAELASFGNGGQHFSQLGAELAWVPSPGTPPTGIWHEFLVAGHAVKEIESWYVGGIRQPVASAQGDPETTAYFLVPGYSAWTVAFGGTLYREYNGHRYTLIYLLEGAHSPLDIESIRNGDTPLTINVKGVETSAEGSGTLLTDSMDIYLHAMQNWVLGDYQTTDWLGTPTFNDPDGVPQIDEASFAVVREIMGRRVSGGYDGAGCVGFDGNFLSVRDFIRQMNVSWDTDCGLSRKSQFFVRMIDDAAAVLTDSPQVKDIGDILKGSFDVEDDFSNHFNVIPFEYKREYVQDADPEWVVVDEARSDESIDNYAEQHIFDMMELHFTRNPVVAADVAARKLLRHKDPPRIVHLALAAAGFNVEIGDFRGVTHFGGIGSSGYANQPVRIHEHMASPAGVRVELRGYDMSRLFSTVFILGDETTLVASWNLAVGTDAGDRLWGYLCDEVTGLFSDGSPGKRLR